MNTMKWMSILAAISIVTITGCSQKTTTEPAATPGIAEKTGAALDKAANKTVEVTGMAVEKTGEVVKKGAEAVENTGADMQK